MNDDIWNSIRFFKKHIGESDQNEMTQGGQQDKKYPPLEEYNNQFRKSKQALKQMKVECNCGKQRAMEIRQLKSDYEEEIRQLKEEHEKEMKKQKQYYEEQLISKDEDIENMQLLISNNDQEQLLNDLKDQFEKQINQERELFKKQLERQIEQKLVLEQQLRMKEEEVQSLVHQFQKQDSCREQISQNCASSLFRDTNRKSKLGLKDKSVVEEECITDSLHCSIKDFNQKVKLMDRSISHHIN